MIIETKFDIGEILYHVFTKDQKRPEKVRIDRITFDSDKTHKIKYDSEYSLECFQLGLDISLDMFEENLYRTEAEAYERLEEIQKGRNNEYKSN